MPSFTINLQNLVAAGPIVEIILTPTQVAIESMKTKNQPVPNPVKAIAMVDTGATSTVIIPEIAKHLGLQPVGQINMVTPSTKTPIPSIQC